MNRYQQQQNRLARLFHSCIQPTPSPFRIRLTSCSPRQVHNPISDTIQSVNDNDNYLQRSPKPKCSFPLNYVFPASLPTLKRKLQLRVAKSLRTKSKDKKNKIIKEQGEQYFIKKFKQRISPKNASNRYKVQAKSIPYIRTAEQSLEFDQIRSARQQLQQTRKMVVLGRIMHESARKHLKQLNIIKIKGVQ